MYENQGFAFPPKVLVTPPPTVHPNLLWPKTWPPLKTTYRAPQLTLNENQAVSENPYHALQLILYEDQPFVLPPKAHITPPAPYTRTFSLPKPGLR